MISDGNRSVIATKVTEGTSREGAVPVDESELMRAVQTYLDLVDELF